MLMPSLPEGLSSNLAMPRGEQELRLLQHVMEKAPQGDPAAICEARIKGSEGFMGDVQIHTILSSILHLL